MAEALAGESRAYGFTLVVWGTGALVMGEKGSPGTAGVICYLGGILFAMAVILLATAGGPTEELRQTSQRRSVLGTIHLVSVGAAIALAAGLAGLLPDKGAAYGLAGVIACLSYQLLLGVEMALSARGNQETARE